MTEAALRIIDAVWSCLIITPLTFFYWSGTWKLLDKYMFPVPGDETPVISSVVSLTIGVTVGLSSYFVLPLFDACVRESCNLKHVVISRIFIYLFNFGLLNFWRGIWNLMDYFVGTELKWAYLIFGTSKILLILLRAVSACLSGPFVVTSDLREHFYHTKPLMRSTPQTICRYILDCIVSHIGVIHLSIQVWRSFWIILDHFILPNSLMKSYIVCICVGYTTAAVLLSLQYPFHLVAKRLRSLHWFPEHLFEVMVKVLATISTIFLWRGCWGMLKDFLLKKYWQYFVSHAVGTVLLACFMSGSSVGCPSISVDCEHGWGDGQFYPIQSFFYCYQRRRSRGLSVQADLLDEDDDLLQTDHRPDNGDGMDDALLQVN